MTPQVLKRIVFGYSVDSFSGSELLGYNQLKRMLERAAYDVAVSLEPLNELPSNIDLMFVPPHLADQARQATPQTRVQVIEDFVNNPIYEALIQKLQDGREWTAPKVVARSATDESGQIVRYRGYERID